MSKSLSFLIFYYTNHTLPQNAAADYHRLIPQLSGQKATAARHRQAHKRARITLRRREDYEFLSNYKILQQVFSKQKISKHIEVEKLVKGKCQDNLEFMQWLKRHYDLHANKTQPYDALARRKDPVHPTPARTHTAKGTPTRAPLKEQKLGQQGPAPQAKTAQKPQEPKSGREGTEQKADCEVTKLGQTVEALRKERDFYFGKLRDLELLIHYYESDKSPFMGLVQKILYATEDDKIAINSRGELVFHPGPDLESHPESAGDDVCPTDLGQPVPMDT